MPPVGGDGALGAGGVDVFGEVCALGGCGACEPGATGAAEDSAVRGAGGAATGGAPGAGEGTPAAEAASGTTWAARSPSAPRVTTRLSTEVLVTGTCTVDSLPVRLVRRTDQGCAATVAYGVAEP